MIRIDQIMCPVDLSGASARALRHAAAWARWYEVPLRVLHVALPPQLLGDSSGRTIVLPVRPLADIRDEVERFIAATLTDQPRPLIDVVEGYAVTAILDDAQRNPQALLVMGTHEWTGLHRALREAAGLPFIGVTADLRDGADEIAVMVGRPDGTHLTHVIPNPRAIRLRESDPWHDLEVVIVGRDGSTTLLDVGRAPV